MSNGENPKLRPGQTIPTIVGEAAAAGGEAPTLNDALESAAGKAIELGIIRRADDTESEAPETFWFDIRFVEVELGNQHPKAIKIGVTPNRPGG
jgi:hypothetical protein